MMPALNLKDDELFDKRDLMSTSNSFLWFANVLFIGYHFLSMAIPTLYYMVWLVNYV